MLLHQTGLEPASSAFSSVCWSRDPPELFQQTQHRRDLLAMAHQYSPAISGETTADISMEGFMLETFLMVYHGDILVRRNVCEKQGYLRCSYRTNSAGGVIGYYPVRTAEDPGSSSAWRRSFDCASLQQHIISLQFARGLTRMNSVIGTFLVGRGA